MAYLDEDGRNTRGRAAMFAFAGAQTRNRQIADPNILRVHEDEFGAFLAAWTQWLARTPVPDVLSHQSAVAAGSAPSNHTASQPMNGGASSSPWACTKTRQLRCARVMAL